jgi:proteasome assembly chaperone (PAC2) family protein
MGGLVLLGSTTGVASDARAAVKTTQTLSRILGIDIAHTSLDEKAVEIERNITEAINATERLRTAKVD